MIDYLKSKFVEHEKPFYQLRKNYVYELTCELFRYEDEVIDTRNDEIDDVLIGGESDGLTDDNISTIVGPTQTLTMIGLGVTATAIASLLKTVELDVSQFRIEVLDISPSHQ